MINDRLEAALKLASREVPGALARPAEEQIDLARAEPALDSTDVDERHSVLVSSGARYLLDHGMMVR